MFPKIQLVSQGTQENVTVMEHSPGENTSGLLKRDSPNLIKGLTRRQILEKLTSQIFVVLDVI